MSPVSKARRPSVKNDKKDVVRRAAYSAKSLVGIERELLLGMNHIQWIIDTWRCKVSHGSGDIMPASVRAGTVIATSFKTSRYL